MKIYTINNKHSDCDGHFTITAEDIGLSSKGHTHTVEQIPLISAWFQTNKARANHTHSALPTIKIENNNYNNDIEFVSGSNINITTSALGIVINQELDTESTTPIKAIENANNDELPMTVNINNNVMKESNSINFGGSF
jgi:hypothetical protein